MRAKIEQYFSRYPTKQAVTLPALHLIQQTFGCVPRTALVQLAEMLALSPAQINDTLTFYGFFRDAQHKLGKRRVWVCRSLPCMLRGGEELLAGLCERWGVKPGDTTSDGQVTLELAECLGACDGAPCILLDDELHLNMSVDQADAAFRGAP